MTRLAPPLVPLTRARRKTIRPVADRTLPAAWRATWEAAWDRQFWCFGQDILHPAGNLLAEGGFERRPAPPGLAAKSGYLLPLPDRAEIRLWGFGGFWGVPGLGGITIFRSGARVRRHSASRLLTETWSAEGLPADEPGGDARLGRLLHAALEWVAAYEARILARIGSAGRDEIVARRPQEDLRAADLPAVWAELRERIAASFAR